MASEHSKKSAGGCRSKSSSGECSTGAVLTAAGADDVKEKLGGCVGVALKAAQLASSMRTRGAFVGGGGEPSVSASHVGEGAGALE